MLLFPDERDPLLSNGAVEDVLTLDQRLKGIRILRGLCQLEEKIAPQRTEEKEGDD